MTMTAIEFRLQPIRGCLQLILLSNVFCRQDCVMLFGVDLRTMTRHSTIGSHALSDIWPGHADMGIFASVQLEVVRLFMVTRYSVEKNSTQHLMCDK